MKALIITFFLSLNFQARATDVTPDQMTTEQQTKLIQVLNQLEPEMLTTILSEEAFEWYIQQFSRGGAEEAEVLSEVKHQRIDFADDAFDDPNAPRFN